MKPKEHEHCLRCGRKLKNLDARILGYGAVCYKKMQSTGKRLFGDSVRDEEKPESVSSGAD